jgi:hypothetical protein
MQRFDLAHRPELIEGPSAATTTKPFDVAHGPELVEGQTIPSPMPATATRDVEERILARPVGPSRIA